MAKIEILAPQILKWEGGYVNDIDDPGGATNKGVTMKTWKAHGTDKNNDGTIDVQDLKSINNDDVINVILRPSYWNPCKGDDIKSQKVANILVDWYYNSGTHGIKRAQKVLGVKPDGLIGPKTLAKINALDPDVLFEQLFIARKQHYIDIAEHNPRMKKFLKGWMNRLFDMKNFCNHE